MVKRRTGVETGVFDYLLEDVHSLNAASYYKLTPVTTCHRSKLHNRAEIISVALRAQAALTK